MGTVAWFHGWFVVGSVLGSVLWRVTHRKEARRGRNRQAEEGSHDPGPVASGGALTFGSFSSYYISNAGTPSGASDDLTEVERVESDMPILAHRIALLVFDGTSTYWSSLNESVRFGPDSDAYCRANYLGWYDTGSHNRHHAAPDLGCTCGFYALPSDVEPWGEEAHFVTLMVELSGTVIEHEKGYRAAHQRVVECQMPACPFCGRQAEMLDLRGGKMLRATCSAHVAELGNADDGDRVLLSVEDAASVLPVPVTRRGRVEVA